MQVIPLGISSCLAGSCVRYDGRCCYSPIIVEWLGKRANLIPFCPEHECGMPVPREPMDLYDSPEGLRLRTVESGRDLTHMLESWLEGVVKRIRTLEIRGFILKSGSPSCGIGSARVHRNGRVSRTGTGIFADALLRRLPDIVLVEETELYDHQDVVSFIEKIGGCRRAER